MSQTRLYFAYGANMDPAVLARRGIQPLSSQAAWVDGFHFEFSVPGLPVLEPGFATIRPQEGARVHGVAHRLTTDDLQRLDGFESDQERFEVPLGGVPEDDQPATTYRSFMHKKGLRPSRRYLHVLIRGAELHDLPVAWIAQLKSTPYAHIPIVSDAWTLAFPALDRLNRMSAGRVARWGHGDNPNNDA